MPVKRPRYRAVVGVAVRKSPDPDNPAWAEFVEWNAGDTLENAPAHMDLAGLLAIGAIEEVV